MKKIQDLKFGFNDAESYKAREYKKFFETLFFKNHFLDLLLTNPINFLVGEKGTGKTAYALYLSNNNYKETYATIKYIRETEYKKFVKLKKEKQLELTDYTKIWKVIICLLLAEDIHNKANYLMQKFKKFKDLKESIDKFYYDAFSPEIINAITIIEESKIAAEMFSKVFAASGEEKKGIVFTESRFQTNLMYIQKKFEEALTALKLKKNHIIFIDGIDIRPSSIPYDDYLDCVKGLANAVWSLNNDFFSHIHDSMGRMRVVLLIRPDIFDNLGLQNQNNKIRDNSVVLDWQTTYPYYRDSDIFRLSDKLLSSQQDEKLDVGEAWDYYFPYKLKSTSEDRKVDDSFVGFLRHSYYRPRDIVSMLSILKDLSKNKSGDGKITFTIKDFENTVFKRKFSEYLMGEIKDHLSFYHSKEVYELFLKFFEFLKGKASFSYKEFVKAYKDFINYIDSNHLEAPNFFETEDRFLQFLYDLNVICYVEYTEFGEPFMRWCFRQRSLTNIAPKVKTNQDYRIHYGIQKALNVGQRFL